MTPIAAVVAPRPATEMESAVCANEKCGTRFMRQVSPLPDLPGRFIQRVCPSCLARENKALEERKRAEENEARERVRRKRLEDYPELLAATGANPRKYKDATLDNWDASEAGETPRMRARQFLATVLAAGKWDEVRGLYLFGDTGNGKTHLGIGVIRELLLNPDVDPSGIVLDRAGRLIQRIQNLYGGKGDVEAVMERRIRARLWVLDDLGEEQATNDAVLKLSTILAEREGWPTLVTSNNAPNLLETRHPEYKRMQSRLGNAYFRTVRVVGRDRRFDNAEEAA